MHGGHSIQCTTTLTTAGSVSIVKAMHVARFTVGGGQL